MKVKKKAFTALFPCPVVLVTCVDSGGEANIITLAWAGTVCSEPPMIGLGIRQTRHSHKLIEDSKEFVVNIPTAKILKETDYCGVTSGKDADKFAETKLTKEPAEKVKPPLIRECPVNIECILKDRLPLDAHDLFLGEIVQVHINQNILDEKGNIDFAKAAPFVYNVGEYWSLNKKLGVYGFSKRS
jgi:flavin reductase (DIM6/NTAB) family NADH-FMN oxidoreductase RutF